MCLFKDVSKLKLSGTRPELQALEQRQWWFSRNSQVCLFGLFAQSRKRRGSGKDQGEENPGFRPAHYKPIQAITYTWLMDVRIVL